MEIIENKERIISAYKKYLKNIPVEIHQESDGIKHSYWMFTILAGSKKEKEGLRFHLAKNGIETRPTFHPAHTMPMYKDGKRYPVAEDLGKRGINLPSYPDLTDDDVRFITSNIADYFNDKQ
jgi:perosamine synthetase